MNIYRFLKEHPVRGAIAVWVLFLFMTVLWGIITVVLNASSFFQFSGAYIMLLMVGALMLARLRWWDLVGLTSLGKRSDFPLYLIPILMAFLSLREGIVVHELSFMLGIALFTLLVGVTEELFFRGIILNILRPIGVMGAVSLSAFLFGLPHLLNALGGVWDPMYTLVDTFAALGIGVAFASLFIRTGTILPLIGIHALTNFTSLITRESFSVQAQSGNVLLITAAEGLVLMVYSVYILRMGATAHWNQEGSGSDQVE